MNNKKTENYLDLKGDIIDAVEEMESDCYLLFLFDKNKTCFESNGTYLKRKDSERIGNILRSFTETLLDKKIWLKVLSYDRTEKHRHAFILAKTRPILNDGDDDVDPREFWGKKFNIPACCIKKYIEDKSDDSFNSAIRYFKQLRALKIDDKFGIQIQKGTGVFCGIGFIPCHPKCKEANMRLKTLRDNERERIRLINKLKGGK